MRRSQTPLARLDEPERFTYARAMGIRSAVAVLCGVLALCALREARADLPPPPGQTRVGYSFRVTGKVSGAVLVAYPMYNSAGGNVVELALGQDAVPVQGFTPGIYSLSAADVASLRGQEAAAVTDLLAKRAHVCVKAVPRVFSVPSATHVTSIVDVFEVDASATGCRTTFAKTLYGGGGGEKGEGSVDASGRRVPPAPFGDDLPPVGDLGFPLGGTGPSPASRGTDAPARGGCAGCAVSETEHGGAAIAALALAGAWGRRRRARRSSTRRS